MGHTSSARRVRFGQFEMDERTGELRKDGTKIRLQEQPLQILQILLERPGELVPRDELRKRVWPSDTFVDFDHSLNTAINKVREVLGDSASSPRYVETLARRGYRFIAPVQESTPMESAASGESSRTIPVRSTTAAVANISSSSSSSSFSRESRYAGPCSP